MPNDFIYELTDPISSEKGLYWDSLKGTRSERADILEKLLRDRVMAVTFIRKTDITKVRLAICTRNSCWIKYDPDEEARQDARTNAAASGNTKISTARTKTIYETGVIPVYDVVKGDWISFDVDHVKWIQGVISADIDAIWTTRQRWGQLGVTRIPAPGGGVITHSTGGGGITSATHQPGAVVPMAHTGMKHTGIDTLVSEFAKAEQEIKSLSNLPPDSPTPKPVSDILRDYFRALITSAYSDDLKKEEKQKMFDKIGKLYNKVP